MSVNLKFFPAKYRIKGMDIIERMKANLKAASIDKKKVNTLTAIPHPLLSIERREWVTEPARKKGRYPQRL
ncbi:MAG: hypothetical protein D6734_12775 [Candidatus Schekmanbacteria bacterium]|nr:MAG: hypothetical protein D6734_12775 [Candidatus Schekmanbacteria bacterium]